MKRFIRYLYEYQNGQRVRNVGFVKVEQNDSATVVNIHGKGLRLNGNETLKLYIFYMDENVCRGIWQGDITKVNPAINYRLIFTEEDTGRPENYLKIEGLILKCSGGKLFSAVWDDSLVDVDSMQEWDAVEEAGLMDSELPVTSEEAGLMDSELPVTSEEALMDSELSVTSQKMPEEAGVENRAEPMEPRSEEIDNYIEPTRPQIRKIDRRDLARLPRCEWRLANNSFLMHGYHNYHHLIFLEDADGFWLGVPGIYHEREARAAEAFGFPRFLRMDEEEWNLGEEEMNPTEEFGYWCRKVRMGTGGF